MGKPGRGHTLSSRTEYIGAGGDTRGSETSQYPEEQKSTEIPQVAASERGNQPKPECMHSGVAGPAQRARGASRSRWKAAAQKVTPL
jgi:hypothetical protein